MDIYQDKTTPNFLNEKHIIFINIVKHIVVKLQNKQKTMKLTRDKI